MIALVDCNNFYTSCERVFRPDLENRPVVVLSNNDGCIISRSPEAKALNIAMGSPFFKIKSELQQKDVAIFSSNYTLYGDMSSRVVECMDCFSDQVEVYSVDEAFAKFNFYDNELQLRAEQMRAQILQWVGIPVKVGIAPSKTLAKVAATYAKKKRSGVFVLKEKSHINQILKETPIEKVWGVGRGFQKFLAQFSITTAWEFKELPNQFIRKHMGVVGLRMAHELRGQACLPFHTIAKRRKMILTSRSFSHPVIDYKELKEAVSAYVHECSGKLRNEHLVASEIVVSIETFRHRKNQPQNNAKLSYSLSSPTDSIIVLNKVALQLLSIIFKPNHKYKKAGITLLGLQPKNRSQASLFHPIEQTNSQALMKTIDSLNQKHGNNTIKLLSEGIDQEWKMASAYHSKRATTRWNEIMEL